jgi:prepilin-type N-terminal cleavage/methylation domain-containing protein
MISLFEKIFYMMKHKIHIRPLLKQGGFTIIEVLVTVLLLSLLLVGFRYTLLAYAEQINRSWAERYLEQYGNSIVEYIARNIVNAKDIQLAPNAANFATFYVTLTDPTTGDYQVIYSSDPEDGIKENGQKIFPEFPPEIAPNRQKSILGPSESFEVLEFKGEYVYRPQSPYFNPLNFIGRLFQITLRLKYTQERAQGDNYERTMTFTSQVSLKNRG